MRLIKNVGADRVLDHLQPQLPAGARVDVATDGLSLFAFDELARLLTAAGPTRLLLSSTAPKPRPRVPGFDSPPAVDPDPHASGLLGDDLDRERRNALRARGLAVFATDLALAAIPCGEPGFTAASLDVTDEAAIGACVAIARASDATNTPGASRVSRS